MQGCRSLTIISFQGPNTPADKYEQIHEERKIYVELLSILKPQRRSFAVVGENLLISNILWKHSQGRGAPEFLSCDLGIGHICNNPAARSFFLGIFPVLTLSLF